MDYIDLRSDTVTWPTPAMREAMANAVVGDDVYGEDPTVNQLEAESAAILGKEAGLFVTSGTQGNLIAVLVHCSGRGDEFIVGHDAHTFKYEVGGTAALGGVQANELDVLEDGTFDLDALRGAVRGDNIHFPRTKLICLENTHGGRYGIPVSREYTHEVGQIAREHGAKLHIDGARIFNAAAALKIDPAKLVEDADTLTFCLSKGLCAPAGSILVGSHEFITEARRIRKMLGGGMRQVGILAAAGLIAVRDMRQRLAEDHDNACLLAEGLATIPGLTVDMARVYTNFVMFEITEQAKLTPEQLSERLKAEYGIIMRPYPAYRRLFRAVTHYWISREQVDSVVGAMRALLA